MKGQLLSLLSVLFTSQLAAGTGSKKTKAIRIAKSIPLYLWDYAMPPSSSHF